MVEVQEWVLLQIGCAECGDWPLVVPKGTFDTSAEAAEAAGANAWHAHPSGGFIAQRGSGAWWVAPAAALSTDGGEFDLCVYDAPSERAVP